MDAKCFQCHKPVNDHDSDCEFSIRQRLGAAEKVLEAIRRSRQEHLICHLKTTSEQKGCDEDCPGCEIEAEMDAIDGTGGCAADCPGCAREA